MGFKVPSYNKLKINLNKFLIKLEKYRFRKSKCYKIKKMKLKINSISSIEELKDFLRDFFNNEKVKIFLFGSRAKGNFRPASDIDLAFLSEDDISYKLSLLRDILENSNLAQKVDIIELKKAPQLKSVIDDEGIRWI
ncbi:MAG: nucleotidyltransferase family protein [bacterium]